MLSLRDLARAFDVHTKTIGRWRRDRGFPQPRYQTPGGRSLWSADEILQWSRMRKVWIPNPFFEQPQPSE